MNNSFTLSTTGALVNTIASGYTTVEVDFSYTAADPYAVKLTFFPGIKEQVDWVFGRDIILNAFYAGDAGEGDVKAERKLHAFSMEFRNINSKATVEFNYDLIKQFIDESAKLVVPGEESINIDDELEALLTNG